MTSKRLPGKILHEVSGKPLLKYLTDSLACSKKLSNIIIATSDQCEDNIVEDFCIKNSVSCIRGSLNNVVDRFVMAIKKCNCDAFIRLSGDSPLLDHRLIDQAINLYETHKVKIVSNVLHRTFPKGQSIELFDSKIFLDNVNNIYLESDREHVTPYFYRNKDNFEIYNFISTGNFSSIQLSVDTPDDLKKFETLILKLKKPHFEYSYQDFISLIN